MKRRIDKMIKIHRNTNGICVDVDGANEQEWSKSSVFQYKRNAKIGVSIRVKLLCQFFNYLLNNLLIASVRLLT